MRLSLLFCLTACAASADPERSTTANPRTSVQAEAAVPTPIDTRPTPISGTHGAPIEIVAITREGDAAVSADRLGGIRVWPTLDGRREPVVVHAQIPSALAIAHDGDGFVIANIDAAKQLELVRIDGDGRVRGRDATRGESALDVAMLDRVALVLRADQTIDALDPSGKRTATLVPDAGTRVSQLLVTGDRVLAISERAKKMFGRWIEPSATWGTSTPDLAIGGSKRLAVSPDRTWIVANQGGTPRAIGLATGAIGPQLCGVSSTAEYAVIGFIDADTVMCSEKSGVFAWWSVSAGRSVGALTNAPVDIEHDEVANGVIVSHARQDLVLHRREGSLQLGYATSSNTIVRFSQGGITIAGVRRSLVVDATLRAKTAVDHPLDEGLLAIGDGYAIGISTAEVSVNDAWGESHALSVFDLARAGTHQKLQVRTSDALVFERATGLLATIDGALTHLLRYDSNTHMFGAPIALVAEGVVHRIALLDPALANGAVAIAIEERVSSAILGEIDARDLKGSTVRTRRTYRVLGDLLAIDRAGRVYANDAHGRLRVSRGDGPARELPITGATGVVPDADGSRLVVLTRGEISLYLADGRLVWTVGARDVRQVRWLGNDLVASFADSLARFDLTTGELVARQCGWDFGLHSIDMSSRGDAMNVCDAD